MAEFFRGFSFPFRREGSEFPARATDLELIRQSLKQIVLTGKGERVMRPDFGTGALSYLFENNDLVLEENLRTDVLNSILKYEPRVIVTSIRMVREDTTINVEIEYIVKASRQTQAVQIPLGQT